MSSVEGSNLGHEVGLNPPQRSSSGFKISQSNRSSISDKQNAVPTPSKENKALVIQESGDSFDLNSDLGIGKEWEILLTKLRGWLGSKLLSNQFDLFLDPSLLIFGLIALLFFLKAYSTILSSLGKVPLAPSLCQVIGTLWLIRFSITRLLRKQDRKAFLFEVISRWKIFSGQS